MIILANGNQERNLEARQAASECDLINSKIRAEASRCLIYPVCFYSGKEANQSESPSDYKQGTFLTVILRCRAGVAEQKYCTQDSRQYVAAGRAAPVFV